MEKEYELISSPQISSLNVLLVQILSRAPHSHEEIEIGLILKGAVNLSLSDSFHILSAGDMYVLNPMDVHAFNSPEGDAQILAVQFSRNFMLKSPNYNNIIFSDSMIARHFVNSYEQYEVLKGLFYELAYQYFSQSANYEYKCISLLNMIYYILSTFVPTKVLNDNNYFRVRQRLIRILNYIGQHYKQKILLSDIAENEGLSLTYLSHFFKDNFNMSFREYINIKRFENARILLQNMDKSVADVCIESGFSDPRYLSIACKKYCNCSVTELRKKECCNSDKAKNGEYVTNQQSFFLPDNAISLLNSLREEYSQKYSHYSIWDLYGF